MTKKQKQEIDFLEKYFVEDKTSPAEQKDYIEKTVLGKVTKKTFETNRLFQAKRRLDISVKMWTEDLGKGLLAYWELTEDFKHPFMEKLVNSIRRNLSNTYSSNDKYGVLAGVNKYI